MTSGALGGMAACLVLLSLAAEAADTTPPSMGTVEDGIGTDFDRQAENDVLRASWYGFTDPESSPVTYEAAAGTGLGCTDVAPFKSVGEQSSTFWLQSNGGLRAPLTPGTTYYITLKATNTAGLSTYAFSDGVLVTFPDGTLPPPVDGGVPVCSTPPDGGVPDGGVPDGGAPDGGAPDGGASDGGNPDGGDAGPGPADGGPDEGSSSVEKDPPLGWGCGTAGGLGSLALLVLVLLGLLRGSPRSAP